MWGLMGGNKQPEQFPFWDFRAQNTVVDVDAHVPSQNIYLSLWYLFLFAFRVTCNLRWELLVFNIPWRILLWYCFPRAFTPPPWCQWWWCCVGKNVSLTVGWKTFLCGVTAKVDPSFFQRSLNFTPWWGIGTRSFWEVKLLIDTSSHFCSNWNHWRGIEMAHSSWARTLMAATSSGAPVIQPNQRNSPIHLMVGQRNKTLPGESSSSDCLSFSQIWKHSLFHFRTIPVQSHHENTVEKCQSVSIFDHNVVIECHQWNPFVVNLHLCFASFQRALHYFRRRNATAELCRPTHRQCGAGSQSGRVRLHVARHWLRRLVGRWYPRRPHSSGYGSFKNVIFKDHSFSPLSAFGLKCSQQRGRN